MIGSLDRGIWVEQAEDKSLVVVNDPCISVLKVRSEPSTGGEITSKVILELASFGSNDLTQKRRENLVSKLRDNGISVHEFQEGDNLAVVVENVAEFGNVMAALEWPGPTRYQVSTWLTGQLPKAARPAPQSAPGWSR